jgi:hypothetical protein
LKGVAVNKIFVIANVSTNLLASVSEVLGEENINIENIDFHTFDNMSACSIAVDKYDRAMELLADASFTVLPEENLVVRLKDVPGALAKIVGRFKDADIPIQRLNVIARDEKHSIVGIISNRMDDARNLVMDELLFPK